MSDPLIINDKIGRYKKVISVSGDKSISIRWVLLSSLANGVSNAKNLLLSEDVLAAIRAVKILGIKSKITKKGVKIYGKGIKGYNYKKNITIDARNSGTLGRLILGLLQRLLWRMCDDSEIHYMPHCNKFHFLSSKR